MRTALIVVLLVFSPALALADIPPPPRPLAPTLTGQESYITTSGVPDHAMFDVHNPTGAPVALVVRAIHYGTADGISLPISGIDADNRRVSGTVTIPPGRSVHLVLYFGGIPAADRTQSSYTLTLQATLAGRVTNAETTVARAHRDPIRNIQISS